MIRTRSTFIVIAIQMALLSPAYAAKYKVVVKTTEGDEIIRDATFDVRTRAGTSILNAFPIEKKTGIYTLDVDEKTLEDSRTIEVQLKIMAPGRRSLDLNFLLGKSDQVISVALPPSQSLQIYGKWERPGPLPPLPDCGPPPGGRTGWYYFPVICGAAELGSGVYFYWSGRRWSHESPESSR
jgi:hypothetical protein